MRILMGIVIALAALWSGYWYVGSTAQETVITNWIDGRRADGWVIEFTDFGVRGFPNRFDTTVNQLAISTPGSTLQWQAPFFQVFALSYKPNHIIAAWPETQTIVAGNQTIDLASNGMKASVQFSPDTQLAITQLTAQAELLLAKDAGNHLLGFSDGLFATRQQDQEGRRHALAIQAKSLLPSPLFLAAIDPTGIFPTQLESVSVDAELGFAETVVLEHLTSRFPPLDDLSVKTADLVWGDVTVSIAGSIEIDAAGYPEGRFSLNAKSWQKLVDLAKATELINADQAQTLLNALRFIALENGNPKTIKVPISFRDRQIFVGAIPVGAAPQFR